MKFDVKKGYCCSFIRAVVDKPEKNRDWSHAIPVWYISRTREFTLMECLPLAHKGLPLPKNQVRPGFELIYCPYCGARLPTGLYEQWCDLVEQELGIEDAFDVDEKRLPQELRTDAWWKKRGL